MWGQVIHSAAPVTQNHVSKPEDLMLQHATRLGNQRPDLLTSLMNMSLVPRLPRDMHLPRSSSNVPQLPSFLDMLQNPHVLPAFGKVQKPVRRPHKMTIERSTVIPTGCWKARFDLETCFTPQLRALFGAPEPHSIGKKQRVANFLPFRAPGSSSFWLFLFSDLLSSIFFLSPLWVFPPLLFHLSILSELWLNFLRIAPFYPVTHRSPPKYILPMPVGVFIYQPVTLSVAWLRHLLPPPRETLAEWRLEDAVVVEVLSGNTWKVLHTYINHIYIYM